jgi:hypothetical protein
MQRQTIFPECTDNRVPFNNNNNNNNNRYNHNFHPRSARTSHSITSFKYKPNWSVPIVRSTSAGSTIFRNPVTHFVRGRSKNPRFVERHIQAPGAFTPRVCNFHVTKPGSVTVSVRKEYDGNGKNESCECCRRGIYDMSAYFALPVPIVLLQNYSIVSKSPRHGRYSSVPNW